MKALRQLGFLKLSLRPENPSPDEDHRVLELFRNRAELKKAYGGLQDRLGMHIGPLLCFDQPGVVIHAHPHVRVLQRPVLLRQQVGEA